MKKNKFMVLGISAIALVLILAFAGCVTVPGEEDTPSAAEAAAQLAAEFNAIIPGFAEVEGVTVTLTNRIWFQWVANGDAIGSNGRREVSEGLWIKKYHLTVPAGVTLDITADDAGLYLGNMTFTVNGTVNARSNSLGFEENASEATVNGNGTIYLNGRGILFGIIKANNNVTNRKLILDGVTLVGVEDNNEALVQVSEGGELVLLSGAITGNTHTRDGWAEGGGVYMDGGTFIMSGGEISDNSAIGTEGGAGGGVRLWGGTFTMSGGTISSNTGNGAYGSGGVSLSGGASFTMEGGTIYGSSAEGGKANTAQNFSALSVNVASEGTTAKWGMDGTYTKGGVAQTGGSDIGDSNDTLIAIP